ncbi:MAG: MBL fold metallo-hydrolase [Patescibacteria group bacterium]|jgi:glyoxylase-like metal-dependent hydrolase (beta-lactamase superfamily II)
MAKIEILTEGYVIETETEERASSTAVLVQEKDLNIIVDPGIAREPLARSLQEHGLKPEDIDYIFLTHYHPDHAFGAAWFPKAKLIDNDSIYDRDRIIRHDGFVPGTELAIIHTPGHAFEHCSLAVTTDKGMVIIAGDVFYWVDGQEQKVDVNSEDKYATDMKKLIASRQKLLNLADFIIPGHGKIFRVK